MKKLIFGFMVMIAFILLSCNQDDDSPDPIIYTFSFQTDTEGWVGDFADYPNDPDVENFYEFAFSHAALPAPLNTSDSALRQSGNNHSDNLFMFVKKKITGLEPNKPYQVSIEIEIASNAPSGIVGAGGAPGESVYIKAGASTQEPVKVLNPSDNHYRMNIDKGDQHAGGNNMQLIGNFANGTEWDVYKLKTLKTGDPVETQSDSHGELWVIVGTDSGYESTTTIYYNSIRVSLK